MESFIDAPLGVFVGVTLILFGGAAWLTGQALAGTWRPLWQAFIYAPLLAAVDRFLLFALFGSELAALPAFLFHAAVLLAIAMLAYRRTRARRMVSQYPWLYEHAGVFGWRRPGGSGKSSERAATPGQLPP